MLFRLPLLAFDLASPAMLGWAAAAVAPILIHLWSRRRYRETSWAAMEYLLAAVKSARRRLRFEQWLLLALRTLLVLVVVFAVAEPFLERGGLAFVPGEPTHRVLVLDGSYSMAYKPTDQSRFERAKELAARIVAESPRGDGFTLVLMSEPPRVVVGTPVFDPASFLDEIDALRLPHTSADLPRTLARVEGILKAARREYPRLVQEEVYFVTDLGRVGWVPEAPDSAAVTEMRKRSERLARSATLVIIDVGQATAENVAVTDVRVSEPFATPARDVAIEAELRNFGRQNRSRQLVELLVDGRRVGQEHVDLAAGTEAPVGFSYRFETPGDHAVEVRVAGDALEVDNHRWAAVPVKQSIPVLCVDGRPVGETFGGAADFLAVALSPRGHRASPTMVRAEIVPESALLELDLGRYDCIFLANVAQFTSSEARVLEAYLKSGGSLVFFLGDQVLADRYNRELAGQRAGGVDLLPARLGPLVEVPQVRLDPLGYRHPIVEAFRGRERAGLLTTPVSKYFKLIVPEESRSKVALALGNGDPLIVEGAVHRGRVVLVATSADISWTPMPMWPSYVPIVQEVLAFAIGGRFRQRNLMVGERLGESISAAAAGTSLFVQSPDGRNEEELRLRAEGDTAVWSFSNTQTSGIYTVRFGPPVSRSESFAVNVDTRESDLTKLAPEQLRDEVWPDVPFVHRTSWESPDGRPVARTTRQSRLPKGLLYLVLGLLFAETYLARRFGHHAR